MFKITPKEGLKVMNPATMRGVPTDGIVITDITTYWDNRLKDGDVTIEDLSKVKEPKQNKKEL